MYDISFDLKTFRKLIDENGGISTVARKIGLDASLVNRHYNGNDNRPITTLYLGKYCNYFNVSPDFLFGLTQVKSSNSDIRFVCDYTGLSETAVKRMHEGITEFENVSETTEFVNYLYENLKTFISIADELTVAQECYRENAEEVQAILDSYKKGDGEEKTFYKLIMAENSTYKAVEMFEVFVNDYLRKDKQIADKLHFELEKLIIKNWKESDEQ